MGQRPRAAFQVTRSLFLVPEVEKKMFDFIYIFRHDALLDHVTQAPRRNFHSPDPLMLHMSFYFDWSYGFCIEKMFKDNTYTFEPRHEKSKHFAYVKTKTQISFAVTAKLISAFIFAIQIVQSLYFLKPKFQAPSHLL